MERLDRRDFRFLAVCLFVMAAGAAVTAWLFPRAFPEASIEFKVNRGEARRLAETFLESRGADLKGTRFAGQFDIDENAKTYLERELGLERAGKLYGREAKIWFWRMRWFRSGVKEEERAAFSPLGDLVAYRSVIAEDAAGARLTKEQARAVASAFLAERGLAPAGLVPIEATPVSRPKRTDWEFVDEKAGVKLGEATIRYGTTVSGDRLTHFREFVHVPEGWVREYMSLRAKNEAAGQIATAGFLITLIAMLAVLVTKISRKDVPWKLVAGFGGVAFVLALLSAANDLPLTLYGYDTASPFSAYLTREVVMGILASIGTAAGIALVIAAAEPIYRERFPAQVSLGGAFSPRGIQTKGFFKSVVLGYALAAFFFAYQAVFYVVAAHFGAWAPADVPYSDMLNTALPWATVLLIGFLPAVSEEGISRMFSISFLDRLGAGKFIAVVVPAFLWGFGHSTYPNQPFYIRGLEVGLAGVLIGFLMLRYGVVPLLVWHFTVDAIYTALLLLRSGNSYYVVSGTIASGILLLPLLVSLALYLRRGGFLAASGLSNGDVGFVPAPPRAATPSSPAGLSMVRPLSSRVLAGMGVLALILVSSLLMPGDLVEPDAEDHVGKTAAVDLARRFLAVNGADPAAWRSVAYTATGFPDDEAVRGSQPHDHGGIPGFSPEAARYVIEKGGVAAFRKLTKAELPLAYWVVRFYKPEQKEEWKVLIDAGRSRVVAFVNPEAENAPAAPPPTAEQAQQRALAAAEKLGYPVSAYRVADVGTESRPRRIDTTVVLEATPEGLGEARPRLTAVFHGARLTAFLPSIHVPESFLREASRRTSVDWILLAVRVVAMGALVGLAIILFLRTVRRPEYPWRNARKALFWTGLLAAAGILNTVPSLFRQYQTEMPFTLFRLGLTVSLAVGILVVVLVALIGFVLISEARPGWGAVLRHGGTLSDVIVRAAIASAGFVGIVLWAHFLTTHISTLYEPDPTLPDSLEYAIPAVSVLWSVARGTFAIGAIAAAVALALRSEIFRHPATRALGVLAVLVALLPSHLRSVAPLATEFLPTVALAVWVGACGFLLLRDSAASWVLFGVFTLGGQELLALWSQPAAPDQAAGWWAAGLLALATAALLAGRRRRAMTPLVLPPPRSDPHPYPPPEPANPADPASPTSPWSGSA